MNFLRWTAIGLAALVALSARTHAAYNETPYGIDWLYPSAGTYAAGPADNGRGLSAYNTSAGLTITLPPNTTTLFPAWHICAVNDNGKTITINTNVTSGGSILIPKPTGAASVSTISTAAGNFEMVCLIYDSGGNFRIIWATPATESSLGMVPPASVTSCPINTVPWYSATGTTLACLTVVNNALLGTNASGIPSESAARMGMLNAAAHALFGGL